MEKDRKMKTYEITLSRVLHEVRFVRAANESDALVKAFACADNAHETDLASAIALIEQGEEDRYFDATDEVLSILRRRAAARTLDVTVENVEIKGDHQVVVKDNGFVRPREVRDMLPDTEKKKEEQ